MVFLDLGAWMNKISDTNKISVGLFVACSGSLWKDNSDSHSPQPHRDGGEQHPALSDYGVISQGEFDGDKTFNADQREMKDNNRDECEAEPCLHPANCLQHMVVMRA